MELFIERMIVEYRDLSERIYKLSVFVTKNLKFSELSNDMRNEMLSQLEAMEDYRKHLHRRLQLLGVTDDIIVDYVNPCLSRHLSFGDALNALNQGKCVKRESWMGDKFVVKQIETDISADVVPNMLSLPDSAKELIGKTANKDIHYRNQCLLIKQFPSSSKATNYIPDWNDIFALDWMVL